MALPFLSFQMQTLLELHIHSIIRDRNPDNFACWNVQSQWKGMPVEPVERKKLLLLEQ